MLVDGLVQLEGSSIVNLTVASGTSFPGTANAAELFYRSDQNKLYLYNGTSWVDLAATGGGGTVADPDQITYSYNEDGKVEVSTETYGTDDRVSTYTYNIDGKVEQIVIEYLGSTRTETYTYTDGKVTGMTAVIS